RFGAADPVKLLHGKLERSVDHSLDVKLPSAGVDDGRTEMTSHEKNVVWSVLVQQRRYRRLQVLRPSAADDERSCRGLGATRPSQESDGTHQADPNEFTSSVLSHCRQRKHRKTEGSRHLILPRLRLPTLLHSKAPSISVYKAVPIARRSLMQSTMMD